MLKIDRTAKCFHALETPTLADASYTERYDLQECIFNSPEAFFPEIGVKLFVVGKEVLPSKTVADRIDLLCLNEEGDAVIVELKRGNHKLQLLQAISYAGMVAHWSAEVFTAELGTQRSEELANFLLGEVEDINRRQKIVLIAEAFDDSVLVAAEWLSNQHSADIKCCRVALVTDLETKAEYLVCNSIFPNPVLADQAKKRGGTGKVAPSPGWENWDAALKEVQNPALVEFVRSQLANGRDYYLRKRVLKFYIAGKKRFSVAARQKVGYRWQEGRFAGDLDLWRKGLSDPSDAEEVKDGDCLRLFLRTKQDFEYFSSIVHNGIANAQWSAASGQADADDADAE